MKRTIITEQMVLDFIKLYTTNKLSPREIATKYNIDPSTVRKHLKKNNIPLRSLSESKTEVTTDMVDSFIKLYNKGKTSVDIGKMYNVSVSTVTRYLKDNGVDLNVRKTDRYAKDVIGLYKSGMTQDKIQNQLGICRKTIRTILRDNNIHIRDNSDYRLYDLDENYFENIDTQNKAYALGFLYADGNVSKEKYNIQLSLQERDKHILEEISADMKSTAPLVYKKFKKYNLNQQNQYSIAIHSREMHSDLCKLGVIPNKTHYITYPNFLSEDMHRHFIRGVMDGDGCIHPPYGKNGKIKSVDICGTYDFCCGLKKIIEKILNIHCSVIKTSNNPNRTTYRVTIAGGIQVSKFLDWIYEDANLYLYRKHELYQKYYNKHIA